MLIVLSFTAILPTRFHLVAALTIATLVGTAPAHAFELFGIKFFEGKKDEPAETIGEPQRYTVDFVVSPSEDAKLEAALRNASTLWKDRDEPASGVSGLLAKARGDYKRLLSRLYAEGRYGGVIHIYVGGNEAADLPPDATLPDPVAIRVQVEPGPLFRLKTAEIVNPAPAPRSRYDKVDLPRDEGFVSGEVARSGTIIKAGRLSVEAWRQQGHAKVTLAEQRIEAAHDLNTVDAVLEIDPGRRATYGPVSVEGTERMDPGFVAFMTGLPPGQEYDPDDIKEADDRLARLDVFRSARIEEAEAIGEDGSLPMKVTVQERLARRFGVGGSFSTVDGIGFETYWLHRNLFGRAERLRIEAKVAGIGAQLKPEEFTFRFGATLTKPGIYTPDTDFVASLIGDREVLEPYTRNSLIAEAGISHRFDRELSARLLANAGYSLFDDDEFGEREFYNVGLLGGLVYDSRDNAADATEGVFAEAVIEPFYEINYGNPTLRMTAEGRTYYGFGEDNRLVAAARLKIGSLVGSSIAETAPDKLFFAGGGGSVRGYAYRNIGVSSDDGDEVLGGRSLIEGSIEARARFTDTIGAVAFADAGYVGAESFPGFSEDLRIGAGVGLRYITGFGPIRLDVAVPLDRREDDPSVAFYVGIGQAF